MKPIVATALVAISSQIACAQFIIQGVQFGGANIFSEAATHDDTHDAADAFNYSFSEGFQPLAETAQARSQVAGSFAQADAAQDAIFATAPDRLTIDVFAVTFAHGESTHSLPGQRPNTSASDSSSSFVLTFEATERFELNIDGSLLASSLANADSLAQLFIYDQAGVRVQAAAASSGDQSPHQILFDERLILPPGQFVIELISVARASTIAFDDSGVLNSTGSANWLLTFDMRALPKSRGARP